MTLLDRDRAKGMIFGLALGDALGWPVEFMARPEILAKYGRGGIQAPPDPALYTDDTQMTAAVAEALIEAGQHDLDVLMGAVARQFIGWKRDPITPTRAPGATSIRGVNALERGAPWREAGVRDSKGCGGCMRVAPVGYLYQYEPGRMQTVARAQGVLTHRHPTSDAACMAAAYLIKLALENVDPAEFPVRVLKFVGGAAPEFDAALERVTEAQTWTDIEAALGHIGPTRGGGWIAEEAVGMALYCVMRHPTDLVAAVQLGANISGDSDSVASIAGGIMGARLGTKAIPPDWLARLENRDYLQGLAERLAAKKAEMVAAAAKAALT
ncbi:MAG: ADP-ribosylglycohydrolase family protein [Anaerolineales bacterium]|nr:ADP-ribosylglycohydrolase family protein [Anaerolineales bacterium]